jgi:hypothetical protein
MTNCPRSFVYITTFYVDRIFNYSSVIFSFLSAFIWLRVIRNEQQQQQKGQMFKYLFVSSLVEAIYFILGSPDADYYSNIKNMTESVAWNVWFDYFYIYFYLSLVSISNYLELLATFDCYIVIKNKFRFMQTKKFFNITLSAILPVCFILNSNYILERNRMVKINDTVNNGTIFNVSYHLDYVSYLVNDDLTIPIGYYRVILSFTREALPLILLLIVNILILKTLKEVMKKKREIQNRKNDITTSKAELNKLKMIIAICLDYYLLRTPLIIYYVIKIDLNNILWYCLYYYGYASYILSYSLKFFIYYFFNKKFKEYTNSTLRFR